MQRRGQFGTPVCGSVGKPAALCTILGSDDIKARTTSSRRKSPSCLGGKENKRYIQRQRRRQASSQCSQGRVGAGPSRATQELGTRAAARARQRACIEGGRDLIAELAAADEAEDPDEMRKGLDLSQWGARQERQHEVGLAGEVRWTQRSVHCLLQGEHR